MKDFFQYIDDINEFRSEYIEKVMLVKNENTEDKGKDIIFFRKKNDEEYFKEYFGEDFFETNASKKLLSLLEHNYNVNNLYQLF